MIETERLNSWNGFSGGWERLRKGTVCKSPWKAL